MDIVEDQAQHEISLKLYQYLCNEVVGSEDIVRYRRLFYKVVDDVYTVSVNKYHVPPVTYITSGSLAEGLCLPGSDFDLMICDDSFLVRDINGMYSGDTCKKYSTNTLIMDSENSQPGYCYLIAPPETNAFIGMTVETKDGTLLSSKEFKIFCRNSLVANSYSGPFHDKIIHGPCISNLNGTQDRAYCFRCEEWPQMSQNWLSRNRLSCWPSTELIAYVINQDVLLVPIGNKSSGEPNPFEWRLSFSVIEKMLIHSFNHTQLLCYALLKLTLKEIICKQIFQENPLCSYYMKTTVFWISEETDLYCWKPSNLLQCFRLCIKRLLYWIQYDFIPNYFIPEQNMIECKINERSRKNIVSMLKQIHNNWQYLLQCHSLNRFVYIDKNCKTLLGNSHNNFKKALFPLILFFGPASYPENFRTFIEYMLISVKCVKRICTSYIFKRLKIIYAYHFVSFSGIIGLVYNNISYSCNMPSIGKLCNKWLYEQYKSSLSRILMSTNTDALTGWFKLAVFFYCTKHYRKAIKILQQTTSVFRTCKVLNQESIHINDTISARTCAGKTSLFRSIRTEFIKMIDFHFPRGPCPLFCFEHLIAASSIRRLCGSPKVLTQFLRFLCYHGLSESVYRAECLRDLINAIENTGSDECKDSFCISYLYLTRAFEIIKDQKRACSSYCNFKLLCRKTSDYRMLKKNGLTPFWEIQEAAARLGLIKDHDKFNSASKAFLKHF